MEQGLSPAPPYKLCPFLAVFVTGQFRGVSSPGPVRRQCVGDSPLKARRVVLPVATGGGGSSGSGSGSSGGGSSLLVVVEPVL